jgi:phage anti-repressor protein
MVLKRMFEYGFIENTDYQAIHKFVAENGFGEKARNRLYFNYGYCQRNIYAERTDKRGKEAKKTFIK